MCFSSFLKIKLFLVLHNFLAYLHAYTQFSALKWSWTCEGDEGGKYLCTLCVPGSPLSLQSFVLVFTWYSVKFAVGLITRKLKDAFYYFDSGITGTKYE